MLTRKPKPKYGWRGSTPSDPLAKPGHDGVLIGLGDRVYHRNENSSYPGTVVDGPIKKGSSSKPYWVWMVKWDKTGNVFDHTCDSLIKIS